MPRGVTTDTLLAISQETVRAAWLVDIEFANRTLHIWTGVGNLAYGGNTYTGVGALGSVSPVSEALDARASGITLTLGGVDSEHLAACLDEVQHSKRATLRLAVFNQDGSMISTPAIIGSARLDSPTLTDASDRVTIALTMEHELADLERPRLSRYTDEDQQSKYPGDKAFEFVSGIPAKPTQWGEPELPDYKRGTKGDMIL